MSSEEVRRLVLARAHRALEAEYGGVLVGGAKKRKKSKSKKSKSEKPRKKKSESLGNKAAEWREYYMKYAEINGLTPKEAMCAAAPSYRKKHDKPRKKLSPGCKNSLRGKKYVKNSKKNRGEEEDYLKFLLKKYFKKN